MGEILKQVDIFEGEQKQIKHELLKLCWFMRGGVTLDEAYNLSYEERMIVSDIIKDNLETTKKSKMPFF